jgi:hypothetical protein
MFFRVRVQQLWPFGARLQRSWNKGLLRQPFKDLRKTREYQEVEYSRLENKFTHSRDGWPFARTLKYRLGEQYIPKQQMVIRAGDKRGTNAAHAPPHGRQCEINSTSHPTPSITV